MCKAQPKLAKPLPKTFLNADKTFSQKVTPFEQFSCKNLGLGGDKPT